MSQLRNASFTVIFLLVGATTAQAGPTVNFISPAAGNLVDATELIRVNVVSAQPLQSIEITDGTTTLPMIQNGSLYEVVFPFPYPYATPVTMTVTVTDVLNDTDTDQRSYIVDHRPILTVTAPLDFTVARPHVRITATCTDDDPAGCDSISYTGPTGGQGATVGGSSVDQDHIIIGNIGKTIEISVFARDSSGQTSDSHEFSIPVDPSPDIINVVDMPGKILDFDATHIVYTYEGNIVLYDRNTAATSQLAASPTSVTHLVADGVVFVHDPNTTVPDIRLWHWHSNGVVDDLGHPNSQNSPRVQGDYLVWSEGNALTLRQLSTGQNTVVTTNAGNDSGNVAPNGEVCFTSFPLQPYDIYFYNAGATNQLTNDPTYQHGPCSTDGTRVIYGRRTPQCPPSGCVWDMMLYDGSLHSVLASYSGSPNETFWAFSGLWAAYSRWAGSVAQVFLLSPSGQETQISNFSVGSIIDRLSSNGEATFRTSTDRWIYQPGLPAGHVNSPLGIPRWINGKLEVAIGRSLFAYVAPSGGDAGVGDSGIDAGVPQDSGLDAAADVATIPDAGITPDAATDSAVSDAAIADAAVTDTASIDVTLPSDTSTITDAGPTSDALTQDMPNDAGSPDDGASGGCAVSKSPSFGFLLVLLVVVVARRRHQG